MGVNLSQQQGAIDKETAKNIEFNLSNIWNIYSFLEIGVIQYTGGNQIEQCYIVDKIPINKDVNSISYIFTDIVKIKIEEHLLSRQSTPKCKLK